ncbi:hypothetical protein CsatB_014852 [Cannabis sativa]
MLLVFCPNPIFAQVQPHLCPSPTPFSGNPIGFEENPTRFDENSNSVSLVLSFLFSSNLMGVFFVSRSDFSSLGKGSRSTSSSSLDLRRGSNSFS